MPTIFRKVSIVADLMSSELSTAASGGDLSGVLQNEENANATIATTLGNEAGSSSDKPSTTAGSSSVNSQGYVHKPLSRLDAHDPSKPHPLRLTGSSLQRDSEEQTEPEQELEAIPESPKSDEGSNEVQELQLSATLVEQAVLRVVKDAPPGSMQLTITEPASKESVQQNVIVKEASSPDAAASRSTIEEKDEQQRTHGVSHSVSEKEPDSKDTAEKSSSEPMEKVALTNLGLVMRIKNFLELCSVGSNSQFLCMIKVVFPSFLYSFLFSR